MVDPSPKSGRPAGEDPPNGSPDIAPPPANALDQLGSRSRVLRVWQTVYLDRVGRHVQFMQFGKSGLRPLIWLHSVEYPMCPPWGMCVDAADKGYSIISIRRPGFGETSSVADREEEVAVLTAFLDEAGFENAILIAEGTARPAGIGLARASRRIAFTLLARPAYLGENFNDIDPLLREVIVQTLESTAGARASLAAINQLGRSGGHQKLYESFVPVRGDANHIRHHERDLSEAWACFAAIKPDTFQRELSALALDASLTEGALGSFAGVAVIGKDTPDAWRAGFEAKSAQLGIRTAVLPAGSLFALYLDCDALLGLVAEHAG